MQWFLIGLAAVYTVLAAWALGSRPDGLAGDIVVAATLIGVPVSAAWLAGEVFLRISPRRAFDLRVRRRVVLFVSGVIAGAGGVVFSTALLGVLEGRELLILGGCSAGFAVLVLGRLSRARKGCCVHCLYDLSGTSGPRCPECGEFCSGVGPVRPAESCDAVPIRS